MHERRRAAFLAPATLAAAASLVAGACRSKPNPAADECASFAAKVSACNIAFPMVARHEVALPSGLDERREACRLAFVDVTPGEVVAKAQGGDVRERYAGQSKGLAAELARCAARADCSEARDCFLELFERMRGVAGELAALDGRRE